MSKDAQSEPSQDAAKADAEDHQPDAQTSTITQDADAETTVDVAQATDDANPPEADAIAPAAAGDVSDEELAAAQPEDDGDDAEDKPDNRPKADKAPAVDIDPEVLTRRIEAALIATDKPLKLAKLSEAVGNAKAQATRDAIESLNAFYAETERAFRIEEVAGGYQILTLAEYHDVTDVLARKNKEQKLTPAQLETLAIIAYKQPILRAEIEAIRGVASGEAVRALMERRLVKITGRADEVGRPMLYGTTKAFLQAFGLSGIKDLPKAEELKPKS